MSPSVTVNSCQTCFTMRPLPKVFGTRVTFARSLSNGKSQIDD